MKTQKEAIKVTKPKCSKLKKVKTWKKPAGGKVAKK